LKAVVVHRVQKKGPLVFFPISGVLMFQCSRFLTELFLDNTLVKSIQVAHLTYAV